jgi:hypothetical protein
MLVNDFFRIHGQIRLQALYILIKCPGTGSRYSANRVWIIVFKILDHFNIPNFPEFVDLHAEVSGTGPGPVFQLGKFSFCSRISKEMMASLSCECNTDPDL